MSPRPVWTIFALIGAALVATPIVLMMATMVQPDQTGIWAHLWDTVLWRYVGGSVGLCSGSVVLAAILGISTAWLVTHCRFPGRGWFTWMLLLPMAMPAYVLAYCWTDLLEYAGPVQTWLRSTWALERGEYWFPEIRSLGGAVAMMGLVLFPYVYLTSRAAFIDQGSGLFESARSLGWGPWRCFFHLALPLARPAIVAGCSLVAMEALADFGTVDYFGLDTFTTGIYRTWEGHGSYLAAVRLSALLLLTVLTVIAIERLSRGNRRFYRSGSRQQPPAGLRLGGWRAALAVTCCATPLLAGFVVPSGILLTHVLRHVTQSNWSALGEAALTSLLLALMAAAIALGLALLIAYGRRLTQSRVIGSAARIAALGYAIPGSVVAIAVMEPLAWVDNQLLDPYFATGLLLSGTLVALVFAYVVRFLAVAMGPVEAGLGTISATIDHSARSLGAGPFRSLWLLHLPLLRGSLATAALLVFVDVLKELPATVLLRPFNTTTLAVLVHDQVSQESLHLAATPALAIVITGLLPVLILTRHVSQARPRESA